MATQPQSIQQCRNWFENQGWSPFTFQLQAWSALLAGASGIVNAPTGSGKTYSLLLPAIARGLGEETSGCQLIWITPIRALAKEIEQSAQRAIQGMGSHWRVEVRTGDTAQKIKQRQKKGVARSSDHHSGEHSCYVYSKGAREAFSQLKGSGP